MSEGCLCVLQTHLLANRHVYCFTPNVGIGAPQILPKHSQRQTVTFRILLSPRGGDPKEVWRLEETLRPDVPRERKGGNSARGRTSPDSLYPGRVYKACLPSIHSLVQAQMKVWPTGSPFPPPSTLLVDLTLNPPSPGVEVRRAREGEQESYYLTVLS